MRYVFSLVFLSTAVLGAPLSSIEKIDYSRFSLLFTRAQNDEDPSVRFAKLENLRAEAQASLERLIKKTPSADLEFRFADLLLARAKDMEQFAMELALLGREREALPLQQRSKALQREALNRFNKILRTAGKHPLIPKIHLAMGRTELALGQKNEAFHHADQGRAALSSEQKGKTLDMALWILRGDAAFELARARVAQEAYERAHQLVEKGSVEDAYLTYRLAWVFYNDKEALKAILSLENLFELTKDRLSLRQEAVQDYGLFAADLSPEEFKSKGGLENAWKLLSKVSSDESAIKAIERLGKVYAKNGRREGGTEVFEFLISKDPSNAKNVDRALTIVEWAHSLADKKKLTSRYLWLLKDFGPRSLWFEKQKSHPDVQRLAFDRIESSLRKYAVGLHQEASKVQEEEPRKKMEDAAAELYDAHILAFSEKPRIYFYRAEIFRSRKQWAEAGNHYDRFLHLYALQPAESLDKVDHEFRKEASWGSVQVWAKAAESSKEHALLFLASADRFLQTDAQHPQASQVGLDAVKVELKSSSASVAMGRLDKLILQFPRSEAAAQAVHAGLDLLNKENDYVNLALKARAWVGKLDQWAPANKKKEIREELQNILAKTEAKACEILSKQATQELEAALCFENYAKGFSKELLAADALLMAAKLFEKQNDSASSLRSLEALVTQYPNSKAAAAAYSQLAAAYEKNFEFQRALSVYESLLNRKVDVADREKILTRFLLLASSLGQSDKLERGLKDAQAPAALKRKIEENHVRKAFATYSLLGNSKSTEAQGIWAEIEKQRQRRAFPLDLELEYHRLRGVAQRDLGKMDKADEAWMAGLRIFWKAKDRSGLDWQAAARLRLEEASVWEKVFRNTDLKKNPQRKIELFQKLEAWYAEILKMKSPVVALESLAATAQLYAALAHEMKALPETAAKSEEFKAKALEIIRQLSLRAQEWRIISPVALSSLKILEDIQMGKAVSEIDFSLKAQASLAFPWPELGRWVELSKESLEWKEWNQSSTSLRRVVNRKESRAEARRSAFVLLVRKPSLKDAQIKAWSEGFVDKSGIQMRIQALIADKSLDQAQLFIEQYESLFGADAFIEHQWGRLAWARGNFEEAYTRWMHSKFETEYRVAYWQEGWRKLVADLAGGDSQHIQGRIFDRLAPLAKTILEKQSLAQLCFETLNLGVRGLTLADAVKAPLVGPSAWNNDDGQSSWEIRRRALRGWISQQILDARSDEELQASREALRIFSDLEASTDNSEALRSVRRELGEKINTKERSFKEKEKPRLAEVKL